MPGLDHCRRIQQALFFLLRTSSRKGKSITIVKITDGLVTNPLEQSVCKLKRYKRITY